MVPDGAHLHYWDSDAAALVNQRGMEIQNHWCRLPCPSVAVQVQCSMFEEPCWRLSRQVAILMGLRQYKTLVDVHARSDPLPLRLHFTRDESSVSSRRMSSQSGRLEAGYVALHVFYHASS